jgi:phage-related minor tail protein
MADKRKVQLDAELTSDGVRKGVAEVKGAVADLANDVKQKSGEAAKGVEGIGAGGDKAAKQIERDTKNIIASIERATARIKSAETGAAGFYETLAGQRGVNTDALRPYLEQLRQAEQAQKVATRGLDTMGASAKQTAAALRQVPAQFTDIITSLQGGQAPLTVLLQQGGQLKDTFGGIIPAAKALGGFILGLVNPFTVAAAAAGVLGVAYLKGASEATEFSRTLILTGNAAGTTVGALNSMAQAVNALGSGTVGKAAEVLNQLAATGNIGAANLTRFAAAAINLEKVGGPAASETAKAFADLAKSPLQAALKLNEATNFLTVSVLEQIAALEQQGRTVEAAKVAQESYAAAIEQRSPAILGQLGLIERGWIAIKDATKGAADAALSIGRAQTSAERIGELQRELSASQNRQPLVAGTAALSRPNRPAAEIQAELNALSRRLVIEQDIATAQAEQARQVKATAVANDELIKLGVRKNTLLQEEERIRNVLTAAGKSEKDIQTALVALREKFNKASGGDGKALRERQQEIRLLNELAGATADYTEDVQRLVRLRQSGTLTEAAYLEQLNALIAKQPFAKAQAKDLEEAQKNQSKATLDAAKAYEKYIEALDKSAGQQQRETQALADQFIALTAGKEVLDALVITRREDALAIAEQALFTSQLNNASAAELQSRAAIVQSLKDEIALRKGITQATANNEATAAAKKAADDSASEFKRASEQIQQSITDALIRGFESGKGAAENFRDVVQNLFKTLVLRPGIEAVVKGAGVGGPGQTLGGVNVAAAATYLVALDAASNKQFGTAIGTAVGQAVGGPVGAAIGNTIGSLVDRLGRGSAGSPGSGSVVSDVGGSLGTRRDDDSTFARNLNSDIDAALRAIVQASTSAIESLTGVATDATAKFGADGKTASSGQFILSQAGVVTGFVGAQAPTSTTGGGDFTRFASDPGQGLEQFAAEVARVTREALEAANLPQFARDQIAALGADANLEELAQVAETIKKTTEAITTIQDAFESLGGVFGVIAGLSDDTFLALSEAAGGFDSLQASLTSYYSEFFTDAERQANELRRLTAAFGELGLAVPTTREGFRALVTQAQDDTTEAGARQLGALLALSGAFAELVPATEQLSNAAEQTSEAIARAAETAREAGRRAIEGLTTDRTQLEIDALRARGDTAGASALQRSSSLSGLTAGVNDTDRAAIVALFDYNEALRQQIAALDAAAEAAQRVTDERVSLEVRLLQAQGDTATLRQREIDALDPSNRAILSRIFALEDEAAATQRASAAAAESAAQQNRIASERGALELQLLQLQGDITGIRQRERSALDESNRALFDQITALQDQQAAAEESAAASAQAATAMESLNGKLQNLASTRFDLENQLLSAQGRGGEVNARNRERDLAELTAGLSQTDAERVIAAYDLNEALRQQIEAQNALTQAQQAGFRAADALRESFQEAANSIFDEAARLRGLNFSGGSNFVQAQAQFAVTSAQARAGDLNAAKQLPGLSQALVTLAESQAGSTFELERLRAQIASSLDLTGRTLGARVGLSVPTIAQVEIQPPRALNSAGTDAAGTAALVDEIKALREENRAQAASLAQLQNEQNKIFKRWEIDGLPSARTEAA